MNKALKGITVFGAVVGVCALASFIHDYRKMLAVEQKLNSLPLHQIKEKMATIRKGEKQTVIEIPNDMPYADRLRVCASVLTAKKEEASNK